MNSQLQGSSCEVSIQSLKHRCVATLKTLKPQISSLAVHNRFLYAASDNEIYVFDLSNYSHIGTFSTNDSTTGSIKSIAFHESEILTAHQDCKIRVWKLTPSKEHHLVTTLPTVKDRFSRFLFSRNYVRVRRHKKRLWIEHWDTVSGLVVRGETMYSVSWDKSLKTWDLSNHRCLESIIAHGDAINSVVVSCNGTVYTGSADGLIRVWEKVGKKRKHSLVTTLDEHKSTVNALALNNDGSVLFSGGCDRSILVWQRNDGDQMKLVEALKGHSGAILCLINVDHLLVSGSEDCTVRIWKHGKKTGGYHCMFLLEGHERPVKSLVAISNKVEDVCNGFLSICSGSLDGEIKIWEVSN